jgi:MFS family permease
VSNGYNQSIIGGAVSRLGTLVMLSTMEKGLITSALCIGGAVGCICSSFTVRQHGKRGATIIAESFASLCIILQSSSTNPYILTFFRIGVGFGSGICVVVKPLYVAELSPPAEHATTVGLFAWGFSFGLCTAQIVDAVFPEDGTLWAYPLLIGALFPLLMLLIIRRLPEAHAHERIQVGASLAKDCSYLFEFVLQLATSSTEAAVLVLPLLLANQWTGMALLMTDATGVLHAAGIDDQDTVHMFEILFSLAHILGVSMAVVLIWKFDINRRTLLLTSLVGMVSIEFATGAALFSGLSGEAAAVGLIFVIFVFQAGIAPCFYILGTQVWKGEESTAGYSLLMACWFISGFLVTFMGSSFGRERHSFAMLLMGFAAIGAVSGVRLRRVCPDISELEQAVGVALGPRGAARNHV